MYRLALLRQPWPSGGAVEVFQVDGGLSAQLQPLLLNRLRFAERSLRALLPTAPGKPEIVFWGGLATHWPCRIRAPHYRARQGDREKLAGFRCGLSPITAIPVWPSFALGLVTSSSETPLKQY